MNNAGHNLAEPFTASFDRHLWSACIRSNASASFQVFKLQLSTSPGRAKGEIPIEAIVTLKCETLSEWWMILTFPLLHWTILASTAQKPSISHIIVLLSFQILWMTWWQIQEKQLLWLLSALVMKPMIIAFHTECFCQNVRHLWW